MLTTLKIASSLLEDQYTPSSDEAQVFHDPINKVTQHNASEGDPVLYLPTIFQLKKVSKYL